MESLYLKYEITKIQDRSFWSLLKPSGEEPENEYEDKDEDDGDYEGFDEEEDNYYDYDDYGAEDLDSDEEDGYSDYGYDEHIDTEGTVDTDAEQPPQKQQNMLTEDLGDEK
ncbi:hypothetical protein FBEOM_8870 [Fusarium beomiforme]|uniref:Uncharacterized protein n=1 Tax=Fusarium beomiforme TaxID=44412 RepID=A0A9P5AEF8_9HYPO|nr:hypothetical protein FBEOM_8870 [Fusarium beomiforme]